MKLIQRSKAIIIDIKLTNMTSCFAKVALLTIMTNINDTMEIITTLTNSNATAQMRRDTIVQLKEKHELAFSIHRLNHVFTDLRILLDQKDCKQYLAPYQAVLRDMLHYHFNMFVALLNFIDSVGSTIIFHDYFKYFIGGYYEGNTYCYCLNLHANEHMNQVIELLQKYNHFDINIKA